MGFFAVVCYDVSNDKSRLSIAHTLMGYGVRVQKSVFECHIETPDVLRKLWDHLIPHLKEGDSLRIYYFCHKDQQDICHDGGPPTHRPADYLIVG
jgi:CRISPR-associated protein Cas2